MANAIPPPPAASTIIGTAIVANADPSPGFCRILGRRTVETIKDGRATPPFPRFGDRIRIEMRDHSRRSVFGAIEQEVVRCEGPG